MKRRRRVLGGCLIVVILVAAVVPFTGLGRAVRDFWQAGIIQAAVFNPEDQKYDASRSGNLKTIYTALMLYHESEGQFPKASVWMDAIQPRMQASNMSGVEAAKKLIRPDLAGRPGAYGYSMNRALSEKYKGDIKDAKTPLVFESEDTSRNASGDPATTHGREAITVDGSIIKLK